MSAESVLYELRDGVAHVTLNRPQASNAFDLEMGRRIEAVVGQIEAQGARSVLVTGAGPRFCAGGDLGSMAGAEDLPATLEVLADQGMRMNHRLADLRVPVVAAVHGAVAGAGLAIMLACDVVVAARGTKFVMAFSGVGLTPDSGVSHLLTRAVGQVRALDFALTGRVLTAEEALEWGLVSRLVEPEDLATAAGDLASRLASGPAFSLAAAKRLVRAAPSTSREQSGLDELAAITEAAGTEDARRLIAAFFSRS